MNIALIKTAINKILKEGGDSNYFVIDITKDYYIQAASSKGAEDVFCEAVSNQYLSKESKLTDEQLAKLKQIGWNTPTESNVNFFVERPANNKEAIEALANFISTTVSAVYSSKTLSKDSFQFHLE
ncbi:hypothetical protein VB776_10765 [Arcicella sp. DC2W]|uniref:TY-Chap N-terminal domain-containing protein n=1 Tax=Arcicella gelida TaxID=2984195 RepID=A0ABU5S4N9_9BACT|nr:hypothetical protein [Arcicella sp. DC2W]MEA5403400.1 hypothetical protein [Arcicella sp. DC2W]